MATFRITRHFNAPRDIVWKAWTNPEWVSQWFGPKGFTCKVLRMELRPSGMTHSYLKSPEGAEMWGKFIYREVTVPTHLSWIHSFSDAQGNTARHPMHATWPLELLANLDFAEENGGTRLTLTWDAHNATAEEQATFDGGMESMTMGWTGTFDQLDTFCIARRAAA